jgi:hypothetical protein
MATGDPPVPARYCSQCGRERLPGARFCVGCGIELAGSAGPAPSPQQLPVAVELLPAQPYPVSCRISYQPLPSRPSSIGRLVLAVPHLLLWALLAAASLVTAPAGWCAALVLGRLPGPIHRFHAAELVYVTRTSAYLALAVDRAPPFPWQERPDHPLSVTVAPPAPLSRLRTLVALPLALPAVVTALMFGVVAWMLAIGAWWAIVLTGRLPRTIHDMQQLAIGFQCRTLAHMPLLLTGVYPWYESGPLVLPARRSS